MLGRPGAVGPPFRRHIICIRRVLTNLPQASNCLLTAGWGLKLTDYGPLNRPLDLGDCPIRPFGAVAPEAHRAA